MGLRIACAVILGAALVTASSCAHNTGVADSDLVVFGQVRTLHYEPLDEFGLSGVMTARLTITRVLSGRPPSSGLTVRYIAHSDLPPDEQFRFHLRRAANGIYVVCQLGRKQRGYICK